MGRGVASTGPTDKLSVGMDHHQLADPQSHGDATLPKTTSLWHSTTSDSQGLHFPGLCSLLTLISTSSSHAAPCKISLLWIAVNCALVRYGVLRHTCTRMRSVMFEIGSSIVQPGLDGKMQAPEHAA